MWHVLERKTGKDSDTVWHGGEKIDNVLYKHLIPTTLLILLLRNLSENSGGGGEGEGGGGGGGGEEEDLFNRLSISRCYEVKTTRRLRAAPVQKTPGGPAAMYPGLQTWRRRRRHTIVASNHRVLLL